MANAQQIRAAQVQAIVVMGAGVDMDFPDGVAQLQRGGLDRLRKGVQLSRATGIPILYTGGRGWGSKDGAPSEAAVAARVAEDAFGLSLQWQESDSRDTRENALLILISVQVETNYPRPSSETTQAYRVGGEPG